MYHHNICNVYSRAIGTELAKVERVSLVTGGFFGAADITAKTFCEYRAKNTKFHIMENKEESAVVHILPMHDTQVSMFVSIVSWIQF